jgi:hypothetical protein
LAISFYWGIKCVHPQLHLAQPKSHFFFCHLVEMYGHDFQKSANAVMSLDDDTARLEVGTQIHTNAIICDAKGKRSSRAIVFGSLALAAYLLTIIPFVSMAYDANAMAKVSMGCATK